MLADRESREKRLLKPSYVVPRASLADIKVFSRQNVCATRKMVGSEHLRPLFNTNYELCTSLEQTYIAHGNASRNGKFHLENCNIFLSFA